LLAKRHEAQAAFMAAPSNNDHREERACQDATFAIAEFVDRHAAQIAEALAPKPNRFDCGECQTQGVAVDEDGCCRTCGSDAKIVVAEALAPAPLPYRPLPYPREISAHAGMGMKLTQTEPPNSYLTVTRIDDGREVVSTPCVVTEDKDYIIQLLFIAWLKLANPAPMRGTQEPTNG
jgi:hypothetical protein